MSVRRSQGQLIKSREEELNSSRSASNADITDQVKRGKHTRVKAVLRVALVVVGAVGIIFTLFGIITLGGALAPNSVLGQGITAMANGLNMNAIGFSQFFMITGIVLTTTSALAFCVSFKKSKTSILDDV